MPNRLADATSPYLLQHKDNPVDWWEWGDDAFAEARRRDVPVLLSVGYAACHWCHVMAHESFEDTETAALMNALFVNVKVDREERPDVDAAYMAATTALTGQGGWPMTVFLTPDGKPFYAGTYFPAEPRHQLPAFRQVLQAIADAWAERREDVLASGDRITATLRQRTARGDAGHRPPPDADRLCEAVRALARDEDLRHGGFGTAPKFPPSMVLEFLLRHAATDAPTAPEAAAMAGRALTAMARSGMYDQVAGGFARYSVDAGWVVPHFEKMLYDNALLARVYLHWWRLTGEPTGRRVAQEVCDWMLADLRTPHGGLSSSLDADTPVPGQDGDHAVEGATYVWTPAQLVELLGEADGAWAGELLGVSEAGTFEHGTSTAQLRRDVWADPDESARWVDVRGRLAAARAQRPQPARDDKVVAAWNGLAVAALAEVGVLCDRPDLVAAAEAVADLLLAVHLGPDGRLRRVSRDGVAGAPSGVLEDYADVAEGLLALHAATGEAAWVTVAGGLLEVALAEFADDGGGFYDAAGTGQGDALEAMGRHGDPSDNAYPSGSSAAAGALLTYSALTGSGRHREAAEAALGVVDALAGAAPRFAGWGMAVAQAALDGPLQVAVVGPAGDDAADPDADPLTDPATARLHRAAIAGTAPGLVVSVGSPVTDERATGEQVPLLRDRGLLAGAPAAYVCRGFVCDLPTSDAGRLASMVGARLHASREPSPDTMAAGD